MVSCAADGRRSVVGATNLLQLVLIVGASRVRFSAFCIHRPFVVRGLGGAGDRHTFFGRKIMYIR